MERAEVVSFVEMIGRLMRSRWLLRWRLLGVMRLIPIQILSTTRSFKRGMCIINPSSSKNTPQFSIWNRKKLPTYIQETRHFLQRWNRGARRRDCQVEGWRWSPGSWIRSRPQPRALNYQAPQANSVVNSPLQGGSSPGFYPNPICLAPVWHSPYSSKKLYWIGEI